MADTASTSKVEVPTKVIEPQNDDHPAALGVLEEDDEFEEFAVAGTNPISRPSPSAGGAFVRMHGHEG